MSVRTNFFVDLAAFVGILLALEPRMTGIAVHEWLSLAVAGTVIVHLLLHWDWVTNLSKRFFNNPLHISRVNYVVDLLAFISFIVAMLSGLVISRVVMPSFDIQLVGGFGWRGIHNTSANLTLLLVAVHFGLHWDWVRNVFQRIFTPPFKQPNAGTLPPQIQPVVINSHGK